MPVTDVATFIGPYPYRHVDHGTDWLLSQMDRLEIEAAWVGYLPAFLYTDPAPGNAALELETKLHADRLHPVPTINPELPGLDDDLNYAIEIGAPAVRLYPQHQGVEPAGPEMRVAAAGAAAAGLPVVVTVRFEDPRQRHPTDTASAFPAAAVRTLVRTDPEIRILVAHAERAFIEEVHFGLTPDEASRVLWDISWIWGPPEDHFTLLLETVGAERFTFGTGMPLRIPDAAVAKIDLLERDDIRGPLMGGNLERWLEG